MFTKKGAKNSPPDSSNGPNTTGSGPNTIEVKPDPNGRTTHLAKRPIYVLMAVIGVAGLAGFEYMEHSSFDFFGGNKKPAATVKVGAAKKPSGADSVPNKKVLATPPQKPAESHDHHETPPSGATNVKATSTGAKKPPKNPYAAQDAAFQSTLGESTGGSQGGNSLSWTSGSSAASPAAPQKAPIKTPTAKTSSSKKHETDLSTDLVKREVSPYELLQGSTIPAVLQSGIKSYLKGQLTAVVSENVYSSVNGATLLIPAGSKLMGAYNTDTKLGINRLAVAWTRIEFPNGTYINLPGFNGAGGQGYSGFSGDVNDHTWLIFKNALLMSIVEAGMAVASPSSGSSSSGQMTGNTALQDSEQSLAQTFGQTESQLLSKYIGIAPTITVAPGYVFQVVATQDLVFPGPYNPQMQTGSGKVEPARKPSEANPYEQGN